MKGKLKNCGKYQNGMLKVHGKKIRTACHSKTIHKKYANRGRGPPIGFKEDTPFVISFVEKNYMSNNELAASCSHSISRFVFSINEKKVQPEKVECKKMKKV